MDVLRLLLLGIGLSLCLPALALTTDELAAALGAYEAYSVESDPIRAGARGDHSALGRWPDNSPPAVARRRPCALPCPA